MKTKHFYWLFFVFILFIIILEAFKLNPYWVEKYYTQLIYHELFKTKLWFSYNISFSVGDLFYLLVGLILIPLIKWSLRKRKKAMLYLIISLLLINISFQLSWGLNYYRPPLTEKLAISSTYSEKELLTLVEFFLEKTNKLHQQLQVNDSLPISYTKNKKTLLSAFTNPQADTFSKAKAKFSLFSLPLSYMGFAGYLNPFTLEAQINSRIPAIQMPITIAHELAHQQGYAAENEANFIGFLTAYHHAEPYIQYAANLFGFRMCYFELYKANEVLAKSIFPQLRPGVVKNIREANAFWKDHQNIFEPLFRSSYDQYLKTQGQKSGIKSYNEVIGLLIESFKSNPPFERR